MVWDLETAYKISVGILLVSTLISAIELTCIPTLFVDIVFPRTDINNKHAWWILIHLTQACLVILTCFCLFITSDIYFNLSFVALASVTLLSYRLRKTGKDGSDQLRVLAFLSYSLCLLLDKERGQLASLCFTGAQVMIAYTTSGLVKVFSKHWRKGDVLSGILSTYSYGVPRFAQLLGKNIMVEKTMTYAAIITMLAVPVSFLMPFQSLLLITLSMMILFHFATSILMGLNDFLFTFPLAYPGILLLHSFIFSYSL